jgi:CO/xanthine dehydrogenase Mo-binding subunit
MRYKQAENYVATAMEVAVEPETGEVTVRRVAARTTAGGCAQFRSRLLAFAAH